MWQEDRHQRIRALLASCGRVSAERIAAELDVSRETIRRDLLDLEQAGDLLRVRGGAVAASGAPEPPIALRVKARVREKRAIARAAALRILPGQTIFLDAGSTTSFLAEVLIGRESLMVITNSVDVAQKLSSSEMRGRGTEVLLLGGHMMDGGIATCGASTIAEIHRYHADMAILSPVGFDLKYGATSFDTREADVARAMVDNAQSVVILADYAKIGSVSRVGYCPVERVDVLITDGKAEKNAQLNTLHSVVGEVVSA